MKNYSRLILLFFIPLFYFNLSSFLWPEYSLALTVFLTVITLWLSELIPLPVTGLLVPCLVAITGLMPASKIFSVFGNEILFLFIGSFLLAASMHKHKLDQRIALTVMSSKWSGRSVRTLTIIIGLICFSLSMWISNTAACALMVPLCLGMINSLTPHLSSELERRNLSVHTLLLCTYTSSIGGIATPVGSPPNLLVIDFLQRRDIFISFVDWLFFGLPAAIAMLVLALVVLQFLFPLPTVKMNQLTANLLAKKSELGPIKAPEYQVAAVFSLAVFFWVLPGLGQQFLNEPDFFKWLQTNLPIGSVAILAALLLFVLPIKQGDKISFNLTWEDAKCIDWGTILLFGGGLCLGAMLDHTGLANALAQNLFPTNWPTWAFLLLLVAAAILMSEFSSNTASAAILIPIAFGLSGNVALSGMALACAVTLGASYGFMLPVSTPPNAIVYGTGKIQLKDMVRTGILFDLCGLVIIAVIVSLYF